ncbi:hypothetical protein BJ165DRAFT_1524402 [Panaeolus papilionaceus]|nr:hypothetical protein BJ165DRAFT_1524402 [Panaeolus papilionaceus]
MSRQWVIVDDSDTNRIQYDGQWLSATPDNDINGLGNFGVPFKNSLHALNTNGSLSFSFNDSAVRVYGTTRIKRVGDVDDPAYECILDGANIPINPPLLFPENN